MKSRTKVAMAVSLALCLAPIGEAMAGVDFNAGDWKVDISGNVNAFYVNASCDNGSNTTVAGGLACTGSSETAVRNGLLPAALVFSAKTRQDGYDIGVTIGFYPGINSSAGGQVNTGGGLPAALQTPGIDARQAFFTFGDPSWGTIKMGRDIGIFGRDAILDDMTLLGVGSTGGNAAPSNTSLGRIGLGYIYTDWEPQITYTTPNYEGFSFSAGIFQPLTPLFTDSTYARHDSPQFQAGASYAWGNAKNDEMTGKVWADVVSQKAQMSGSAPAAVSDSFTGSGFDAGIKVGYAGFEGVLYGYTGSGVGTTGLYVLPVSASDQKRDSSGGYAQLAYKTGKVKFGVSYGQSKLDLASDEVATDNTLVKRNSSGVAGIYYSLTPSVTLVGEYINTKAKAWNGNEATEDTFALGGIIFF